MICKKCGANIPDDEKVCPYCGETLEKGQEEAEEKVKEEIDGTKEENLFPDKKIYENEKPKFEEPVFSNYKKEEPVDSGSFWYGVLGFFFPLIGLILFCVWRKEKPTSAKQCGIGALIGFILGVIFSGAILCCCLSIDWDKIANDPNLQKYVQRYALKFY